MITKSRNKPAQKPAKKQLSHAQLKERMLNKLEESALDAKDAQRLKYTTLTAEEAKALKIPAFGGFKIPYFDAQGKLTKFFRVRYLESTKTGFSKYTVEKPLKYIQQGNTINEVYLPPFMQWSELFADPTTPLIITEGELKAACACKYGLPAIGLGGVWCFKSNDHRMSHLPIFDEINWKNKVVYIAYDSDAVTNHMVKAAEIALCNELLKLGAQPYIVRIPAITINHKIGLDDYLVSEGAEAFDDLLTKAEPYLASQELHKMNQEVAYVRNPGIILRMDNLQRVSVRNFIDHAYSTRTYIKETETANGTKMTEVSVPAAWIKWQQRFEVECITYAPGEDKTTSTGELNVWAGWGVEPDEGDVTPWKELLDFLFGSDDAARHWFEMWCAYPLQNPGTKMFTAAVIWGTTHGTGKTLIGHSLGRIYGKNWTEINDRHLHETHNEWAENKQFVMGDEITSGDKRGIADRMKSMITQQQLRLNPKYIPSYVVPDCINYYFTSNHPDAFFLEDGDRRFFIHQIMAQSPLPREFYRHYEDWLVRERGANALFGHLLALDTSTFDPKSPAPMTRSKREMIADNRTDLANWIGNMKEDPDSVLKLGEKPVRGDLWTPSEMLAIFDAEGKGRHTAGSLGRELKRQNVPQPNNVRSEGTKTSLGIVRLYIVRNIDKWIDAEADDVIEHYEESRTAPIKKEKKF